MMTWWCMSYIDYHWFSYAIAEHRSQRVTSAKVRAAKSSAFRAKLLGDKCWIEASKPQQLQLCKRITSGLLETTLDHFGPLFFPIYMFIIVYSRETKWVSGQQSKLWDLITFGTMPWHLANLGMLQSCFSQFQPVSAVSAVSAVLVQCCQWVKTRPRHFRWHRTTKESDGSLGTETSFAGKSLSMSWDNYESSNIFQLFPLRLYIALSIASHQSV